MVDGFSTSCVRWSFSFADSVCGRDDYTYQGGDLQMAAHPQFAPLEESSPTFYADSVFKEEIVTVGNDNGTDPIPGLKNRDRAVSDSIRRNLGVVDKFIAICEKSVREQPDNEMAREYLYGAYQQKAELLATATSRSVMGGLQMNISSGGVGSSMSNAVNNAVRAGALGMVIAGDMPSPHLPRLPIMSKKLISPCRASPKSLCEIRAAVFR